MRAFNLAWRLLFILTEKAEQFPHDACHTGANTSETSPSNGQKFIAEIVESVNAADVNRPVLAFPHSTNNINLNIFSNKTLLSSLKPGQTLTGGKVLSPGTTNRASSGPDEGGSPAHKSTISRCMVKTIAPYVGDRSPCVRDRTLKTNTIQRSEGIAKLQTPHWKA